MASDPDNPLPTLEVQKVDKVDSQNGIVEVTLLVYAHGTAAPEGQILLTFDADQAQVLLSQLCVNVPRARRQLGQRT